MQTFKDKQQQLFKWDHLPEKTLSWLETNWPGVWRREIIPMINERLFSGLYCANDGRASKATADMVGIMILKEFEDLTDEETVGRVMLDIGWQYALDMAPGEAYVAERTIQYFRANVLADAAHTALFADLADRIIAALGIRTGTQRKDSSHIVSNMKTLRRLELFVRTIGLFLRQLKEAKPGRYEEIGEELRKRYIEREAGRFGDARGSEGRRRVEQCAADAWLLLETFRKSKRARALDGYRLLKRLFSEQCEVEGGTRSSCATRSPPTRCKVRSTRARATAGTRAKAIRRRSSRRATPPTTRGSSHTSPSRARTRATPRRWFPRSRRLKNAG